MKALSSVIVGALFGACSIFVMPAFAEDAPAAGAAAGQDHPRIQWCKDNPDQCKEMREKRQAWCKDNPDKCEQMKEKMKERRAECQANPEKCQEIKEKHQQMREQFKAKCDANPTECEQKKEAFHQKMEACKSDPSQCPHHHPAPDQSVQPSQPAQ